MKHDTFDKYPADSLELPTQALLTAWDCLPDFRDDLVLVGGLAVHYLTKPPAEGLPGAVTLDVDFGVSIAAGGGAYPGIRENLSGHGFKWENGRFTRRFKLGIANNMIYQHAGWRCPYNNMKNAFRMLVLALVAAARACGGEALMPEANVTLRFAFPDLPDTFATMESGEKQPAQLTARLPENYSREGRFPLCVYLEGGNGGRGDRHGIARAIVGSRDFICVNLPLFKRAYHTNDGGLVSLDDFQTVSRAYGTMLQKLLDTVPNITPERSVLGGFSNGAHTAALLVAGEDEFTLRHFQAFYFAEGGAPLAANALQKNSLRRLRFLYLRSDRAGSLPGTEGWPCISQAIEHFAKAQALDFTTVVMRDTGHDFPPKYMALTGRWIRGERPPPLEKE